MAGQPLSPPEKVRVSKALSYLLRHGAEKQGIPIGSDGFIKLTDILLRRNFSGVTPEHVCYVVANCEKQRFTLREDSSGELWIRANQGHSMHVEHLELTPITDPTGIIAVHGTTRVAWENIKDRGLSRMQRQHVHFACGLPGSGQVISGMRASCEVHIYLDVATFLADGGTLVRSTNGVLLSPGDAQGLIPPKYFASVTDEKGLSLR